MNSSLALRNLSLSLLLTEFLEEASDRSPLTLDDDALDIVLLGFFLKRLELDLDF